MTDPLDVRLEVVPLRTMAINTLLRGDFHTLAEVAAATDADLLRLPSLGRKSLEAVRTIIEVGRSGIFAPSPQPQPTLAQDAQVEVLADALDTMADHSRVLWLTTAANIVEAQCEAAGQMELGTRISGHLRDLRRPTP